MFTQGTFFDETEAKVAKNTAKIRRNDPLFLRNQFNGQGKYGIPLIKKQKIDLKYVNPLACTNTIADDQEYFDFGVHFFVDDYDFGNPYENPGKTFPIYFQYRFCCTPDYSVYGEMHPWRQIESVAHSRWCGAYWQSKGMKVIPTISWDRYPSFEYCFDGVEEGSTVIVATYACRLAKISFMKGYDAMLERINPDAILCYGTPFEEMRGNVIPIAPIHPRQFHRELKASHP